MRRWVPLVLAALFLCLPTARAAEPVAATVETTLAAADGQIRQFAFDGDPDTYFASERIRPPPTTSPSSSTSRSP